MTLPAFDDPRTQDYGRDFVRGRFLDTGGQVFNVKAFGAVGDGVTDDTTGMQAAALACENAGGGIVHAPLGRYLLTSPLLLGDNTVLDLGEATILRGFSSTGTANATIRNRTQSASGNSYITVRGGLFDIASASQIGKHFGFWGCDRLRIVGCRFIGVKGDWNITVRDCDNVLVHRVFINNGTTTGEDGIHFLGGDGIVVSDCDVFAGDDALSFTEETAGSDTDISNVVVSNCYLRSRVASAIHIIVAVGLTTTIKHIRIQNVTCKSGTAGSGQAILLDDRTATSAISDVQISGAFVDHSQGGGAALQVTNNLPDLVLRDVLVDQPSGHGVDLNSCERPRLENVRVTGTRGASTSGIILRGCTDFVVAGGSVNASTLHGINVTQNAATTASSNGLITGMRITSCASGSGIRLLHALNCRVRDNFLDGNGSGIVEDSGDSDYNLVEANDVRNNGSTLLGINGTNSVRRGNLGYRGENRGTAQISAGGTSIAVNHGLATSPSGAGILVCPTATLGAATFFWVDTVGATSFTINLDQAPGSVVSFIWSVSVAQTVFAWT